MSVINGLVPWILLGAVAAILIIRAVYLVKVDGKALDLRLTPIRILILIFVVIAVVMGVWTVPHGPR